MHVAIFKVLYVDGDVEELSLGEVIKAEQLFNKEYIKYHNNKLPNSVKQTISHVALANWY